VGRQREHGAETGRARSVDERVRLFVAVPLPEGLLPRVRAAQAVVSGLPGLVQGAVPVRLLRPDQLHVTLAFIGEVGPAAAATAGEVVAAIPRGSGGVAVVTDFLLLPDPRRARVVALAVDDPAGVMAGLYEIVMGRLTDAGVMRREARPFRPHLTIARLRTAAVVQPKVQCESTPYPVSSVCLYRSELSSGGARYTVVGSTEFDTDNGPGA
jgi:RNA 2',3'-cyclic 3'-phosphodiesterase